MAKLFISYSRIDNQNGFVRQLVDTIHHVRRSDVIWWDEQLRGGDIWWDEIRNAIADCDIFVYLLSNESIGSPYCQAEYTEATRLNKLILTVQVRGRTTIPDELSEIQYVDMTAGTSDGKALTNLFAALDSLTTVIPKRKPKPRYRTPTPKPNIPTKTEEETAKRSPINASTVPLLTSATPVQPVSIIRIFLGSPLWQGVSGIAAILAIILAIILAQNNLPQQTVTHLSTPTDNNSIITATAIETVSSATNQLPTLVVVDASNTPVSKTATKTSSQAAIQISATPSNTAVLDVVPLNTEESNDSDASTTSNLSSSVSNNQIVAAPVDLTSDIYVGPVDYDQVEEGLLYPCDGKTIKNASQNIIVRAKHQADGLELQPIINDASIRIIGSSVEQNIGSVWYLIGSRDEEIYGWVHAEDIVPSSNCPMPVAFIRPAAIRLEFEEKTNAVVTSDLNSSLGFILQGLENSDVQLIVDRLSGQLNLHITLLLGKQILFQSNLSDTNQVTETLNLPTSAQYLVVVSGISNQYDKSIKASSFKIGANSLNTEITPLVSTLTPRPIYTVTTIAVSYPCSATIISFGGNATIINSIYARPLRVAQPSASLRVGQLVTIANQVNDTFKTKWYQIMDENQKILGWIPNEYVLLSKSCPA